MVEKNGKEVKKKMNENDWRYELRGLTGNGRPVHCRILERNATKANRSQKKHEKRPSLRVRWADDAVKTGILNTRVSMIT